jgi:serine/threonine-protein kinase
MSSVRYQSLAPLHSGQGSRAFLGLVLQDGAPPRPVVLIWAPQEIAQSPELTAKLSKETARALVFEHPNILRVYALAAQDGGLARVTEFADGEPLRRVLEASPRLPPPLAALVAADAATGLHYAHMAGNDDGSPLVHGDLRPETLMVSYAGVTKVTGYGALGVAPRERDGKRVRNRRAYSAPEQLLGGREAVNVQSDVFLLGLVLHECLSGKMPFKESADPDKAVLNRSLPPLPQDVPLKLDAVVRKATAKRAYDRYPSALAFREALVDAVGTLPAHTSLADFLAKHFPPESEARLSRRRVVEAGIAEVMQKAGVPPPVVAEFLAGGTVPAGALPRTWPALPGQFTATGGAEAVAQGPASGSHPQAGAGPAATLASGPASGAYPQAGASPASGAYPQAGASPASGPQVTLASGPASGSHAQLATGSHAQTAAGPASGTHAQAEAAPSTGTAPSTGSQAQVPAGATPTPGTAPGLPAAASAAPKKSSRAWGAVAAVGLLLVLGATAVVLKRLPSNIEAEGAEGGLADAVAPLPGTDALADAGAVVDAGTPDAGPQTGILDLTVDPRVDVSLQGTLLGRTPLSVSLPPGRHVLALTNAVLGIQVARTVTITAGGRTSQQIYLNKGFVTVRAPKDAIVTVNDRLVGAAPVEELDLYEGTHQLLVIVNGARWQKTFKLEPGQRVSFDVDFEKPAEEE